MKKGLLLLNLGTPKSTRYADVAWYLFQFLCDKRVIDSPMPIRHILFFVLIAPFRLHKTVLAYRQVWTKKGSPLLLNSIALEQALRKELKGEYQVRLAMRYGEPHLKAALCALQDCETITILPLFPQFASASTGSALEAALRYVSCQSHIPALHVMTDFYDSEYYIEAQSKQIAPYLDQHDHVLLAITVSLSVKYSKLDAQTSVRMPVTLR